MSWIVDENCIKQLWERGYTGKGVTVAHLDTGIAGNHPTLRDKVFAFRLYEEDGSLASTRDPIDTGYHGTHLAGIICGDKIDGHTIGVAPDARLLSAAVINRGDNLVRILGGMDWVLTSKARILLLPFGTSSPNPVLYPMLDTLRRAGVLVICAIGNRGARRSMAPGNYANVLAVGAVDEQNQVASFSGSLIQDGLCLSPFLLAPGVDVLSADKLMGLKSYSGTSQAAAFVAGVAALLLQARPEATVDQLEFALAQSCSSTNKVSLQHSRFGIVNPKLALDKLLSAPVDACIEQVILQERGRYVDPLLRRTIAVTASGMLYCVFVTAEHVLPTSERSAPEVVINHMEQAMNEKCQRFHTFLDGRTASVTATPRFLNALIDCDFVLVASAPRLITNFL